MADDKDSAVPDSAMLEALQKDADIPHLPTQETYQFRMAVSGQGPLAYKWSDKPHRLLYDACSIIEAQAAMRQPTQSDAMLEGDTQTILYLLGVRHGREDERAKIAAEASQPTQSDDEAYDLGKRDGYETAVQDIDMLTGGDGEYCYSTIEGERHCPNVDTMKARIARRLRQPTQSDAMREALEKVITSSNLEKAHEIAATTLEELRQPTQSDALRDLVAALYCASGCSCCRDDDAWEKASDELGQLFNIPKYKNGYGYDWHSVHEAALQEQSK